MSRLVPAATAHKHHIRVYYEDTDAGGVVYHAGYLRFAERARTEALRAANASHRELERDCGLIFVVHRLEVRYLRPARLDDLLSVLTETVSLGGATVGLRQTILCGEASMAELLVRLACVRITDGKPARIPDRWRCALAGSAFGEVEGFESN